MFDLLDRPLVFIPVKWPGLKQGPDGAAVPTEHVVDIQVEILDQVAVNEWLQKGAKTQPTPAKQRIHEIDTFRAVAKNWRGLKNSPVFDDDNIAKLLVWPGFADAFGVAYLNAWNAKVETREGNSEGSPANGPAGGPTDETPKAETSPN